jgi:hypothetical protein
MSIVFLSFIGRERGGERQREDKVGGGSEPTKWRWGHENNIFSLEGRRQYPLVLLLGVKHMIRINSKCNCYGLHSSEI